MKGGLTAPRNTGALRWLKRRKRVFNEGGADRPPKLDHEWSEVGPYGSSMKGGLTAPRNGASSRHLSRRHPSSMKGGLTAPRNAHYRKAYSTAETLQ